MPSQASMPLSSSGPQRSSTIKASNQPAFTKTNSNNRSITHPSRSEMVHSTNPLTSDAFMASASSSASTLQPVLHSLVFPSSSGNSSNKSASSSDPRLQDAFLSLDEAAPRLSIFSTGSGSTCELATPENLHQSWPYDHVDGSALSALHSSSASSSTQTPDNRKDAYSANLTSHNLPLHSEVELRPPDRQTDARSASLDKLAIQRPAKLERLSSAATNATAKGSVGSDESPQTATQSPRSFQAPDLSSLRISPGAADSIASYDSSSQISKSPSLSADFPSRASMTSPDSWRSLLPEHDPYFASEGQLRASQHQRSASPQSLHPSNGAFDIDAYVAAKTSPRAPMNDRMSASSFDTARTSFSSAISGYSTMSMAGPSKPSMQSHDSTRSDSWRSLLPDDDRYHASRDTSSAHSHHHRGGLEASPSMASPSLSDHLDSPVSFDGHNHRSAFFALQAPRATAITCVGDLESAARRHSSFSSVEPNNSSQYAATCSMLASMNDNLRSLGSSMSASENFVASTAMGGLMLPSGTDSLDAPSMTPALSNSTEEDDSRERDSWPTSRGGGRFGCGTSSPISSGPLTPENGQTPHSKSSLAAVLAQQAGGMARVDSPSHVSETSDSIVKATQDGLLATTTTTTTNTTTSTAAQLLPDAAAAAEGVASSKAKSEAGFEGGVGPQLSQRGDDQVEDGEGLQSQPMKERTSSCSVSTPISPLPFLERRPAPPETDLVIETERTKYVLITRLPGFSLDCITLATKQHSQHRTLHIVADKWDTEGGGHFERRITFPDKECDLKNVKAEFDGNTLRVYVPRNRLPTNRLSSANSATF
ncbi:hypothetical protein NDA16_004520 [Ustilago loliicola]|nr:hypothetical protein NDA16_004520 [Ustilago loliicola]